MRLLILGYSSIVERRVIPAAAKVDAIAQISIASKSRPQPEGWPKQGRFFNDYAAALRDSDSDLIYLSLPMASQSGRMWLVSTNDCASPTSFVNGRQSMGIEKR